jgi:hypothetical protein
MEDFFFHYVAPVVIRLPYIFFTLWCIGFITACALDYRDRRKVSSSYSPSWRRFLYRFLPLLWKKCPEGNYHWRWDRLCFCRENEHGNGWHGGIYDFKTGDEYHRHRDQSKAENFALLYGADPDALRERLQRTSFLGRPLSPLPETEGFTTVTLPRAVEGRRIEIRVREGDEIQAQAPNEEGAANSAAALVKLHQTANEMLARQEAKKKDPEPSKSLWDHLKGKS